MDVLIRLSNQLFWDIYRGVYSWVKEWYYWGSLEEIGFWIQWNLWFVGYQTDSWLECHSCLGTICKKGWYFRSLNDKTLHIMQQIYPLSDNIIKRDFSRRDGLCRDGLWCFQNSNRSQTMTIGSIYCCSPCNQVLSLLMALTSEYFIFLQNALFSNKQLLIF